MHAECTPDRGIAIAHPATDQALAFEAIPHLIPVQRLRPAVEHLDLGAGDQLPRQFRQPILRQQRQRTLFKRHIRIAGAKKGIGGELHMALPAEFEFPHTLLETGRPGRRRIDAVTATQLEQVFKLFLPGLLIHQQS